MSGGTFAYLRFNDLTLTKTNVYRNLTLGTLRTGLGGISPSEAFLRAFVAETGWRFRKVRYGSEERLRRIFADTAIDVFGATAYLDQKDEIRAMCRIAREAGRPLVLGGLLMSLTGDVGREIRAELFSINPDLLIVFGAGMGGQFLGDLLRTAPERRREAPGVVWWDGAHERWNRPKAPMTADACFDGFLRHRFVPRDRSPYHAARDVAIFLQSGGCPYSRCSFCSRGAHGLGRVTETKMLEVLDHYYRQGFRSFKTLEEDVLEFKETLRRLPDLFPDRDVWIDGQMGGRGILENHDLIEEMLSSGLRLNIRWGAENGVDRILEFLGKDVTAAQNREIAATLGTWRRRFPGRVSAEMFLIDLVPDITRCELLEHLDFLRHCVACGVVVYYGIGPNLLHYFPGSALYRDRVFGAGVRPLPWLVTPEIADPAIAALPGRFRFRRSVAGVFAAKWSGRDALEASRRYLAKLERLVPPS